MEFYIGLDGKPIYEERYDYAWVFNNGIAIVELDNKQLHIGLDGKPLDFILLESIDKFKQRVINTHRDNNSTPYKQYMEVINRCM